MKLTFHITAGDVPRGVEEWRDVLKVFLHEEFERVGWQIVSDAISLCPHGFGYLRSTISHRVIVDELTVSLIVGASAIYAAAVEYGSRPHWPPWSKNNPQAQPLRQWAARYLGDENLAYVLARKIAREGTPAQPYLEPAIEMNYAAITAAIETALERTAQEMGGR